MTRLKSLMAATAALLSMTALASAADTANIWVRADGEFLTTRLVEAFSSGLVRLR